MVAAKDEIGMGKSLMRRRIGRGTQHACMSSEELRIRCIMMSKRGVERRGGEEGARAQEDKRSFSRVADRNHIRLASRWPRVVCLAFSPPPLMPGRTVQFASSSASASLWMRPSRLRFRGADTVSLARLSHYTPALLHARSLAPPHSRTKTPTPMPQRSNPRPTCDQHDIYLLELFSPTSSKFQAPILSLPLQKPATHSPKRTPPRPMSTPASTRLTIRVPAQPSTLRAVVTAYQIRPSESPRSSLTSAPSATRPPRVPGPSSQTPTPAARTFAPSPRSPATPLRASVPRHPRPAPPPPAQPDRYVAFTRREATARAAENGWRPSGVPLASSRGAPPPLAGRSRGHLWAAEALPVRTIAGSE
ncbi:hypothetical protein DFH08DRAFT_937492 [Mycena albidolilacea]|uniref:Uncharacterized protein n=1 Tax=Mycena albidolilacea TaxID=1033008 RepID=A0AAD7ERK7_9AGAR|nr:hypothetical protein DFH08DRAFT_937492 [Mycena albidolilacea]